MLVFECPGLSFYPRPTPETQCINITVTGDNFVESNETIQITFEPTDDLDGEAITSDVTIVDDDGRS